MIQRGPEAQATMTRPTMLLRTLLEAAGVSSEPSPSGNPEVRAVELDSRRVRPGTLFAALPGRHTHGLRFLSQALDAGAVAVLSDLPAPPGVSVPWVRVPRPRRALALMARELHGRPDLSVQVVGVTGTNGKTSVVHLVRRAAEHAGRRAASVGTLGVSGVARGDADWRHTTPEAPDLYRTLAAMREEGIELAAVEVSSHALDQDRVAGVRWRVGAFLNLSPEHLDYHGDLERYFEAKASLLETLEPEACAVLPADGSLAERLRERTRARVLTFGRGPEATVRILAARRSPHGTWVELAGPSGSAEVRSPLVGDFVPDNLAAAAACCLAAGLDLPAVASGLASLEAVPGRAEPIRRGQPFTVLVDYAHTPDALERLLGGLREETTGRLRVVFGCGGGRDRAKRPVMGAVAARLADAVYLTSDNPRDEHPLAILREVLQGVATVPGGEARCTVIPDRPSAVRRALADAGDGDVVVLAGKGHENTQEIQGTWIPMDDRILAQQTLAQLGWPGGDHADA